MISNEDVSDITLAWSSTPYEEELSYAEKNRRVEDTEMLSHTTGYLYEVLGELVTDNAIIVAISSPQENVRLYTPIDFNKPEMGEPIFGLVYLDGGDWPVLQYAGGHTFDPPGEENFSEEGTLDSQYLWAEVVTRPEPRKSRDVGGSGSTGSPIFNCDNALVGMVKDKMSQETALGTLPTGWGIPNIVGPYIGSWINYKLYKLQQEK